MRANAACGASTIRSASPLLSPPASPNSNVPLESLPTAAYVIDLDGCITFYNDAAAKFWDCRPALGADPGCGLWRLYRPDGTSMPYEDSPMAAAARQDIAVRGCPIIAERHDGARIPFIPILTPQRNESGARVGTAVILVDISDGNSAETAQWDCLHELNHRFKNMLTMIQSFVSQTLRQAVVPSHIRAGLEGRLLAISQIHDLLMRDNWNSIDFESLAHLIVAPHSSQIDRIRIGGELVRFGPRMALALGMVLHELATNARKHGSLSTASGTLVVSWKSVGVNGSRRLHIDWEEFGGPSIKWPESAGFGLRLIRHTLKQQFKGSARFSYEANGLHCSLELPTHE